MSYDAKVYELAKAFGEEAGLTDAEISTLSQHIQDQIEQEIENLIYFRKPTRGPENVSQNPTDRRL